jgi:hypothetical protein
MGSQAHVIDFAKGEDYLAEVTCGWRKHSVERWRGGWSS